MKQSKFTEVQIININFVFIINVQLKFICFGQVDNVQTLVQSYLLDC